MRKLVKFYDPFRELIEHQLEFGIGNFGSFKWISINSSRGGILKGPWLIVPNKIDSYKKILYVIDQIEPMINESRMNKFQLNRQTIKKLRSCLFAYFLGVLIGDASKSANKRKFGTTRRISLSLTKKYQSNERFGEFVCLCANSLGLRMDRIKDTPKGKKNKYPFYRWNSQSSMLIQWMFNVCLGLNDNQVTTYDTINANWILNAPKDFRIWFLQGLADSDGFVDLQAFQVGIITQPNTQFIKVVLESLGIRSNIRIFDGRLEGTMINIQDAYELPVFNPYVNSYRFELLEKLVRSKRICGHWPKWLSDKVNSYLNDGLRGTQIVKKVLNKFNIAIRTKQIYRRTKEMKY